MADSLISLKMLRREIYEIEMAQQKSEFPHLQSVTRIASLPVVESGWLYFNNLYSRIKESNPIVRWSLSTAESSVQNTLESVLPVVSIFEKPISLLDGAVCRGLDEVEKRVPAITEPPETVYTKTKNYMNSTIIKPVLQRADSVLASKYTSMAAEKLDSALDIADQYVDQYLPNTTENKEEKIDYNYVDGDANKAVQTIHHVDRFSRKLQRRLTQRTLAEARALKQQSQDILKNLLQLAELLARDPKAVRDKVIALWAELSEDEPENQQRPATLEQLLIILTRESARRVVHLVNYTRASISTLPHHMTVAIHETTDYVVIATNKFIRAFKLGEVTDVAVSQIQIQVQKLQRFIEQLNSYTNQVLESVAGNIVVKHDNKHANNVNSGSNNLNAVD